MRVAAVALLALAALGERVHAADLERAKREGTLSLHTSMQVVDSGPLTQAFAKKYGIRVQLWRASGEHLVQRAVTEARAGRHEVDVFETDGAQMEILHRERLLAPFPLAAVSGIPREIIPAHGDYVPSRRGSTASAHSRRARG